MLTSNTCAWRHCSTSREQNWTSWFLLCCHCVITVSWLGKEKKRNKQTAKQFVQSREDTVKDASDKNLEMKMVGLATWINLINNSTALEKQERRRIILWWLTMTTATWWCRCCSGFHLQSFLPFESSSGFLDVRSNVCICIVIELYLNVIHLLKWWVSRWADKTSISQISQHCDLFASLDFIRV